MTDSSEDSTAAMDSRRPEPGVVMVFSMDRAVCRAFPLGAAGIVFGRHCADGVSIDDLRASRRHVDIRVDAGGWVIRDLKSTNGTRVDGAAVTGEITCDHPPVIRFGRTVLVGREDISPFVAPEPMRSGGQVLGPAWRASLAEVEAAAAARSELLLIGENGCGKAVAAAHFHAKGLRASGPFVPVHCAAIPPGMAERLFFGAPKGGPGEPPAAQGYLQAASGGVLFLAEVDKLAPDLLARVLGVGVERAARSAAPDVSFCFGAESGLDAWSSRSAGGANLFQRLTRCVVALPPLRDRREDIPWLAELALEEGTPRVALEADVIEACLLRQWSGNVRELLNEVRRMVQVARSESRDSVRADLLGPDLDTPRDASGLSRRRPITRERVQRALREAPSVSGAAQMLQIHRSHLYRLIRRFGIRLDDYPSLGH
ncbi:MAG TPA: sigma 54-interacting transcriptional regulator [Polyangiaceae bacterium]|jgi:transcriptional regulator of acetoin/glycerol metabolism